MECDDDLFVIERMGRYISRYRVLSPTYHCQNAHTAPFYPKLTGGHPSTSHIRISCSQAVAFQGNRVPFLVSAVSVV
jgi:hypothetical protein